MNIKVKADSLDLRQQYILIPSLAVGSDQTVAAKGHTGAMKLRDGISRKSSAKHHEKLFGVLQYVYCRQIRDSRNLDGKK